MASMTDTFTDADTTNVEAHTSECYLRDSMKMRPRLPSYERGNVTATDTEFKSKRARRFSMRRAAQNLKNLVLLEFCGRLALTSRCSTFARTVLHIVGTRTQEHMFRFDTCPVVAAVADLPVGWDRAVRQFISDTMRVGCALAHNVHLPIAVPGNCPGPSPTVITFTDTLPESISCWDRTGSHGMRERAIAAVLRAVCAKGGVTELTYDRKVRAHIEPLSRCATPPAVVSGAEASSCDHGTTYVGEW
jgi:hypothetical protein